MVPDIGPSTAMLTSLSASWPSRSSVAFGIWGRWRLTIIGAQKTTYTKGFDILVPRPNKLGILEIIVCRIPMFMWSLGLLHQGGACSNAPLVNA